MITIRVLGKNVSAYGFTKNDDFVVNMAIGGTLDEISDTLESVARVIKERDFKSVDPHFFMEGVVVNQKKS